MDFKKYSLFYALTTALTISAVGAMDYSQSGRYQEGQNLYQYRTFTLSGRGLNWAQDYTTQNDQLKSNLENMKRDFGIQFRALEKIFNDQTIAFEKQLEENLNHRKAYQEDANQLYASYLEVLKKNKRIESENGLLKKENDELRNRVSQFEANLRGASQNSRTGNNSSSYEFLYKNVETELRELKATHSSLQKDHKNAVNKYQNEENKWKQEVEQLKQQNAQLVAENRQLKNPQVQSQNRVPAPNLDQTDWQKKYQNSEVLYQETKKINEELSTQLKLHHDFAKSSYENDKRALRIKEEKKKLEEENARLQKKLSDFDGKFKTYKSGRDRQFADLSGELVAAKAQLTEYRGSMGYYKIDPIEDFRKVSSAQNQRSNPSSQQQRPVQSSSSNQQRQLASPSYSSNYANYGPSYNSRPNSINNQRPATPPKKEGYSNRRNYY